MRIALTTFLSAAVITLLLGQPTLSDEIPLANKTAHDFEFQLPGGDPLPLAKFKGKPVLVVNTATECGFKGQLGDLQTLQDDYAERGLVILAVPSNDFGGQEPRAGEELKGYCSAKYGATYQLAAKSAVKGENAHPFYKWAVTQFGMTARPYWNFHKYLIGPDGTLVNWFSTPTRPTAKKVRRAIETQLQNMQQQS